MSNFEWLAQSNNLIDFLYDLTENKEDESLVNESKKSVGIVVGQHYDTNFQNDLVDIIHNLLDIAIYGSTDIATNEEDVFLVDVLKKWDIPRIPNHTGEWAIAKWLQLEHKGGAE